MDQRADNSSSVGDKSSRGAGFVCKWHYIFFFNGKDTGLNGIRVSFMEKKTIFHDCLTWRIWTWNWILAHICGMFAMYRYWTVVWLYCKNTAGSTTHQYRISIGHVLAIVYAVYISVFFKRNSVAIADADICEAISPARWHIESRTE